jgi:pantoate--beta-alanine ligase
MYIYADFFNMIIFNKIADLQACLLPLRTTRTIGFVPTMGALHEGHLSLVRRSIAENGTTVVSIYVNPTQFNDKGDLERYPRDLAKDIELLTSAGSVIVFAPTDSEMYPEPDNRNFNFGELETVMEGKHRPGHFNGVGQIVSKLFDAVQPDKAYFGLKDFQQLAIIKKLVQDYKYPVEIIPCPILREVDGLAMSSRNILLETNIRRSAPIVYKTLQEIHKKAATENVEDLKMYVSDCFEKDKNIKLEYFEIVDDITLQPLKEIIPETPATACIAVFAGKIRLIDNVQLNS